MVTVKCQFQLMCIKLICLQNSVFEFMGRSNGETLFHTRFMTTKRGPISEYSSCLNNGGSCSGGS